MCERSQRKGLSQIASRTRLRGSDNTLAERRSTRNTLDRIRLCQGLNLTDISHNYVVASGLISVPPVLGTS